MFSRNTSHAEFVDVVNKIYQVWWVCHPFFFVSGSVNAARVIWYWYKLEFSLFLSVKKHFYMCKDSGI